MSNLNDPLGALAELDTAAGKVSWFNLARLEERLASIGAESEKRE